MKLPEKFDKKVCSNFHLKIEENLLILSKNIEHRKNEHIYIDEKIVSQVESVITDLLDRIISEDFVQTKETHRCEYCDYKSVCNR